MGKGLRRFVFAAGVGALVGILFAPKEGSKTRKVHPQSSRLAGCGCTKARNQL